MKIVLIVVGAVIGVIVVLIAIAAIIGALLPKEHTATRSAVIRKPLRDVHATIRDFASAPTWRGDVQRVEILGPTRFREHGKQGAVTYDVVEDTPNRLVTRIADQNLGYSGSWTYRLEPEGESTRVTITEDGVVSNVIFRCMSRFVFSNTATMEAYLAALAKHLA
jgi:hypothetical protein